LKTNQSIVKATEKNVEKNDYIKNIDDNKWTSEKSIKKIMDLKKEMLYTLQMISK
jgi:hypothetical protein